MVKPKTYFDVEIPIFSVRVIIWLKDFDSLCKEMMERFDIGIADDIFQKSADGCVLNLEGDYFVSGYVLLALKDFKKRVKEDKAEAMSTLVHECLHVATAVMHNRGIPVSYENDETIAYIQSYLVEQVFSRIGI